MLRVSPASVVCVPLVVIVVGFCSTGPSLQVCMSSARSAGSSLGQSLSDSLMGGCGGRALAPDPFDLVAPAGVGVSVLPLPFVLPLPLGCAAVAGSCPFPAGVAPVALCGLARAVAAFLLSGGVGGRGSVGRGSTEKPPYFWMSPFRRLRTAQLRCSPCHSRIRESPLASCVSAFIHNH